jgi:hypothetical protein
VGKLRSLKELLLFNNKLRSLPFEIGALFQLYTLGLHGNPLDQPLLTYSGDGTEQVMMYLLDNCPITEAPPDREWVTPLKADQKRVKEGQGKFLSPASASAAREAAGAADPSPPPSRLWLVSIQKLVLSHAMTSRVCL